MNYTQIVTALGELTATPTTDDDLVAILPSTFAYADGRIYRELNMLVANVRDSTGSTVADNRNFNVPTGIGTFLTIDGINIITPTATAPESGVRNPLVEVSRDFLDLCWPSTTGATVPQYFSYISQNTYLTGDAAQSQVIFGPWPDDEYRVEVIGQIQPAVLSSSNANTYLTDNLPDLYIAACMVYLTGFQQNFGAQADEPKMGQSWENQYQLLKASAETWEARKRWAGASWTSRQLEPTAQPQRG